MGAINAGPALGIPSKKYFTAKCTGGCDPGQVMVWDSTLDDGIGVVAGVTGGLVAGVALNAASAATQWTVRLQVKGLGEVDIVTDGSTDATDYLSVADSGSCIGTARDTQTYPCGTFGVALAEDDNNVQLAGTYILTCPYGVWDDDGISGAFGSGIPSRKFMQAISHDTIAAGDLCAWDIAVGSDAAVTNLYVTKAVAGDIIVGVAQHAATTGLPVRLQTRGLGVMPIDTDGTTDATDYLVASTGGTGGAASGIALATESHPISVAGYCLAADAANVQAAGTYVLTCPHSWWDNTVSGVVHAGVPSRKFLKVKAGATIAVGDVCAWKFDQASDPGYYVTPATTGDVVVGVAQHAATAGQDLRLQTRGLGIMPIPTDGSTDNTDYLVAHTGGDAKGVALATQTSGLSTFGVCIADDSSNVQLAGTYILTCPHSWWD